MGRLIYLMNVSLDGFIETPDHSLGWATVDEELHDWFNDLTGALDATLYGRRLYELMAAAWPTMPDDPTATRTELDFARAWLAMPKIVFSSTLDEVAWNSRLERGDVVEALPRLRDEFQGDIGIGGPTLAAPCIRRGLVDEFRLVVHPVILGAGAPFFPELDAPIPLRLFETRTFASGVQYLGYRRA